MLNLKSFEDFLNEGRNKKWDEESIKQEALKYNSKEEFKKGNRGAYLYAYRHNMLDELFPKSKYKHWDEESVRQEASKYDTKAEFKKNSSGAYDYAKRYNLLDEFDWLLSNYSKEKRCVYAYTDEDNKVAYVGLTVNKEQRHKTHKTGMFGGKICKSPVFNYFTIIGKEIPEPIYLEDNLSPESAQDKEDFWKHYYEKKGYMMLNKGATGVGTGSLGFVSKWNKISITVEASKYETKNEFRKENLSAYMYAYKHNILDELFGKSKHWNEESIKQEAEKYDTRNEFRKGNNGAYLYALRHNMLDELFPKKKKSED